MKYLYTFYDEYHMEYFQIAGDTFPPTDIILARMKEAQLRRLRQGDTWAPVAKFWSATELHALTTGYLNE